MVAMNLLKKLIAKAETFRHIRYADPTESTSFVVKTWPMKTHDALWKMCAACTCMIYMMQVL
jgi:hypothetical protein